MANKVPKIKPITDKWANYYIPVEAYTEMLRLGYQVRVSSLMFQYINQLGLFQEEIADGRLICSGEETFYEFEEAPLTPEM